MDLRVCNSKTKQFVCIQMTVILFLYVFSVFFLFLRCLSFCCCYFKYVEKCINQNCVQAHSYEISFRIANRNRVYRVLLYTHKSCRKCDCIKCGVCVYVFFFHTFSVFGVCVCLVLCMQYEFKEMKEKLTIYEKYNNKMQK